MSPHNSPLAHVYNPANQSDKQLVDGFVLRAKELKRIVRVLEDSSLSSSSQHFLIEGQRGTGKTSLLLRVKIEIERNKKLSHLIAVQFAEEQYGIQNLCDLWEQIAEELEETKGFETLVDTLEAREDDEDYAQECFYLLEKHLKQNKKKLVLLLDNFGDVLAKFPDIEQKRLRDIFHASPYIKLIASSAKVLEHTYNHDMPFYEFFKIIRLKGLKKKETYALLEKLSETEDEQGRIQHIIKTQSSRIETIRRLTGGIPRTIVLLYEIFIDESANVFEDLESILDRVTPLYKHRMDDLSTQQQAIMNAIALNWDGMSTKEITQKINNPNFSSKKISSQLNQLVKNGYVLTKKVDKKNKLYFLQERFFNIWYLMRYGRKKNKTQVLWLVRFLQEWCNQDELVIRAKRHIKAANEGRLHTKGGVYMVEALAPLLIGNFELQHELIDSTRNALRPMIGDIDKKISSSDKELYELAVKAEKDKNFELAIKHYQTLKGKGYIESSIRIALIYELNLKDIDQAIKFYKMAIEKDDTDAMALLGNLYADDLKDLDQAIVYYKMAIEKGHASAMVLLALLYENNLKDIDQAIVYYKMAIEKDHAMAMVNLACLYQHKLKDNDQAIVYYKMAVEKDYAGAMNGLAWLYYTQIIEKETALKLSEKSYALEKNTFIMHTLATTLLWNHRYQASIDKIKELLKSPDEYQKFMDDMTDYFLLLLAQKQNTLAYELFEEFPDLKQQFKPIYYALMTLLKDEYPKEYLKMGAELEETVQEILQKVEEKVELYA